MKNIGVEPVSAAIEYFKSKEPRGELPLVISGKKEEASEKWNEETLLKATGVEGK